MNFDVLVITNAPGELSSWVKPFVSKLTDTLPEARVLILLAPCPYSSGEEEKMASSIEGVFRVFDANQTSLYMFTGKLPNDFKFQDRGIIVQLGGDQFLSVITSWKTKFPTLIYTENLVLWPNFINKYLLVDQNNYAKARLKGIKANKLSIVGNLMADAVKVESNPQEIRERFGLEIEKPVVTLLPGSKPFKVKYSTSFMVKIADYIARKNPNVQFIMSQSPYTPLHQIVKAVTDEEYVSVLNGTYAKFERNKFGNTLVTEQGTVINIIPPEFQYPSYQIADVAITLPGTNTAELSILGTPMVTIMPLDKIEHIPVEGFLGIISKFPIIGKIIKKYVILNALKKLKYVSIPNQKLNSLVTPEIVGHIHPVEVANIALDIIENPYKRREISLNLKKSIINSEASKNIVNQVIETLLETYNDIEILENVNNFLDWTKRESDLENQ
ncbi:MAG: hypothetical protein U0457_01515 [Candidatus Sericytochromatia bacterium]